MLILRLLFLYSFLSFLVEKNSYINSQDNKKSIFTITSITHDAKKNRSLVFINDKTHIFLTPHAKYPRYFNQSRYIMYSNGLLRGYSGKDVEPKETFMPVIRDNKILHYNKVTNVSMGIIDTDVARFSRDVLIDKDGIIILDKP